MLKFYRYLISLTILASLFCAHKGPPLRIDRIDPKIRKITPINEHQITLDFSEELDTLNINANDFAIYTEEETLKIFAANPGITVDQILLTTDKMKHIEYEIHGKAFDKSGRMGIFKSKFLGSTKPDTIAPWLTHYSKGGRLKYFSLKFSEPVDTLSFKYNVFPKKAMQGKWQFMKNLSIVPANEYDSLSYDTTYYLYVKEIRDLSGNLAQPIVTCITPDTIYNPLFIKGKVLVNDTPVVKGIALIETDKILGICLISHGQFLFEVRDSNNYFVRAFSSNCYGADSVSASNIDNIINLNPGVYELDSIIN
ncbi:MAG: hypothetical protein ACPL28_03745 [bacterium]